MRSDDIHPPVMFTLYGAMLNGIDIYFSLNWHMETFKTGAGVGVGRLAVIYCSCAITLVRLALTLFDLLRNLTKIVCRWRKTCKNEMMTS